MTVAEMIKQTRTESHMTQEEYGAKFGVTRQTVSSWENERSMPDLQMLIDICNTYHISLDKLLNEDTEFVEKIDFYSKIKRIGKLAVVCLGMAILVFTAVLIGWKIRASNMNQTFINNAEYLGFVKENKIYELEEENVFYHLPNQKLPFLKRDFNVKNSYADFVIGDTEISIVLYEGETFAIELNHYRALKGKIGKNDNILVEKSTLNAKEDGIYKENREKIDGILMQLLKIHRTVYTS